MMALVTGGWLSWIHCENRERWRIERGEKEARENQERNKKCKTGRRASIFHKEGLHFGQKPEDAVCAMTAHRASCRFPSVKLGLKDGCQQLHVP